MDGGPLGIVRDGDWVSLDCRGGQLDVELSDEEIARRQANRPTPTQAKQAGGYRQLYLDHVLQADEGCDFDFLVGCRGAAVPRHSH
jgi:dihydroxyacid dehydratase/phosphogluconate dehydratase